MTSASFNNKYLNHFKLKIRFTNVRYHSSWLKHLLLKLGGGSKGCLERWGGDLNRLEGTALT